MQKTKISRKFMSILLVLMMALSVLPMGAVAVSNPVTTTDAVDGLTITVDYATEKVYLQKVSSTEYNVLCDSSNGYYPFSFSMVMSSRALVSGRPSISNSGAFQWAYDETTGVESTTTPYGLATLPVGNSSAISVVTTGGSTITFHCAAPNGGTSTSGSSVYAFQPAPGQFTNEGMGSGGWGDIYDGNGNRKNNTSTGVSLGFFGGYVVYQFDNPIANASTNPYGADFIVYGNAFWNNSEPGCLQVSQDGVNWYDMAGSRYYQSSTVKNCTLTYTNPTIGDDIAGSTSSTVADVPYTGTQTGSITKNTFHNHSWFPLNRNYFSNRTIGGKTCIPMDKTYDLPFADYTAGTATTAASLTLSGVKLAGISTGNTQSIGFGYCDVHPNKSLGGTTAYNPYQSFTSSSDYNTKTNGTSGGDPIDISWAVNADGTPANLNSIQYVRIYTGTAQMNGSFGEVSTEALGVAACTGTGSGVASITPTVKVNGSAVSTSNMGTTVKKLLTGSTATINVTSSANYIYVNGSLVSSGTDVSFNVASGNTYYVQIITQNGTESPYVTVLKITR